MPIATTKAALLLITGAGVGIGAPASMATLLTKEKPPIKLVPIPEICEDDPNAPTEYNCAESLFRWGNAAYDDLIGCYGAILRKDTDTGTKFEKFDIQVALRQGNRGWTIDSWVKNDSDKHEATYIFSEINLEDNIWKVTNSYTWTVNRGRNTSDNKMKINIPIADEIFLDWKKYTGIISLEDRKEVAYSGYWISDTKGNSNWMFSDIKLHEANKDNENLWCSSSESCFSLNEATKFVQIKHTIAQPWLSYSNEPQYSDSNKDIVKPKVQEMVGTIKNTKGRWAKLQGKCAMIKQAKINQKNMAGLHSFWTRFNYPKQENLESLKKLAERLGFDHTNWVPKLPQDK